MPQNTTDARRGELPGVAGAPGITRHGVAQSGRRGPIRAPSVNFGGPEAPIIADLASYASSVQRRLLRLCVSMPRARSLRLPLDTPLCGETSPMTISLGYKTNWKYKLTHSYTYNLPSLLRDQQGTPRTMTHGQEVVLQLTSDTLEFFPGYAWDGPSGPTLDTKNSMRASLVHDGLYQAIRSGWLPREPARKIADFEFLRILKADGMIWVRRWAWYLGVRCFAAGATVPD